MKRENNQLSERFFSIPNFMGKGDESEGESSVFDALPTAIWVLDLEKVVFTTEIMLKELNTDLKSLLNSTKYYLKLISLIQVKSVNIAAVQLYKASSKMELKNQFLTVFIDFTSGEFKLFMLNVLSRKLGGEYVGKHKNVGGGILNVNVNYKIEEIEKNIVFCSVVENKEMVSEISKPLMRVVQNTPQEAGWVYDVRTRKIEWSEEVFELLERSSDQDSTGVSRIMSIVHPRDKVRLLEHYVSLFKLEKIKPVCFTVVLKNEVELNIEERYTVVKNATYGNIETILAVMHVVSPKVELNIEKEMSYEYMTSGKRASFLWKTSEGWPVEQVSDGVEAILGYSTKDFLKDGLLYKDIIHKDDLKWMSEKRDYIWSTAEETDSLRPYRIISKSGNIKWIVARYILHRNKNGDVTHYNGFIEDVTKSKCLDIVFEKIKVTTIGLTCQAYLDAVGKGIANAIGADYLMIGYRNDKLLNRIELVTNYANGAFLEKYTYSDKDTPCGLVSTDKAKVYKKDVVNLFPKDTSLKEMEAEGYIGLNIKNNEYKAIGLISAVFKKPLENAEFDVAVMEQFVNRIGPEIQELKLKELLVKKEEEARALFTDSPIAMWIEDYSEVYRFLKEIKKEKIVNFRAYLEKDPKTLSKIRKLIKIVGINDKCIELSKAKDKQELLDRFHETVTKSTLDTLKEIVTAFYNNKYTYTGEMTVRNLKGAYRDVAVSLLVPPMNRELYDKVIVTVVDVTIRKKTVESLAQKKLYLENYIDSIPLPSMMWDTNYRCIKWNKTAEVMFGYSEKEMLGEHFKTLFFNKINFEDTKESWLIAIAKYGKFQKTTDNATKSGEIISCSWNVMAVKNDKSQVIGYITLAENITERIKEERRKEAILRISKAAISNISLKDFYKLTHQEMSRFLDAENCFIAVCDIESNLIHKDFRVSTKDTIIVDLEMDASLTGLVIKKKKSMLLKTQEIIDLKVQHGIATIGEETKTWIGTPLIVKDKCIGAIVVKNFENEVAYTQKDVENLELIANSISGVIERKRAAKKLKIALKKALQSESLKTSFLANMSHEIRTPMNGIVGFSELLSDSELQEEDRKHYTQLIIDSSKQLLNIVNDILDISQIEAGMIHLKPEIFDINSLLKHLIELHQVKANVKGIELILDPFLNTELRINTDKTKLLQVFSNLVSNAIKFTNKGFVRVGYHLKGEMLEFYVEDSGIGIPEKFHLKIFNRFIQTNEKTKKQSKGNGLGLAICKSFVELFGGEIWIDRSNDEGTKICFNLPYKFIAPKLKTTVSVNVSSVEEVKKKDVTLLIAEDEINNMVFLEEVFSRTTYTILQVENGRDAVEACAKNKDIDIVLMDVKMPIMNGLDASEIIKKNRPNLPIIALSAFAMESDIKYALSKGCDTYISKPINRKLLLKTIVELVSNAKENKM